MAHGVGARGHHPDQSIRRRACVRSGGSGRFTPTAVRLAPPDRTGADLLDSGGPPMGSPHGTSHPCCVPWSGVDTGGTGPGPQGCTRCPTDAAWFRGGGLRLSPPPIFTHDQNLQMSPPFPPPVRSRAGSDQPYRAWTCVLLSSFPTARRRQPADQVTVHLGSLPPAHAFSQSCFLVLFPSFFLNFPSESIIPVHQRPPLSLTCL